MALAIASVEARAESTRVPTFEPCPQSARDSASLFGEPTAIVEAKNEGVFEVCFAGSKTRISCRSGESFVTVTDQPLDFCGSEADALKEAVRGKRKFNADEISRFLNSVE